MAIAVPRAGFPGVWARSSSRWRATWLLTPLWIRVTWILTLAVGLTGIVVIWGQLASGDVLKAIGAVAYVVTPLGSGILITWAGVRLRGKRRWAWLTIGAGVALWGVGEIIWEVYVIIGVDPSYPGIADVFYLAAYPTLFVGVLLLPQIRSHKWERVRLGLDAAAGTVAVVALAWTTYLSDAIHMDPEAGVLGNFVTMAYPIMDVVLFLAVLILATRQSAYRFAGRIVILAMAMLVTAMADTIYLSKLGAGTYADGDPLDAVWLAGYVLFAVAASFVAAPTEVREQADQPSRLWPMIAPYTAVAILVAATVKEGDGHATLLQAASALVALLVIARQGVSIRENREAVETQRNDLVASISHELRTPLTAIAGFIEVLDEGSELDEDERAEMIGIVNSQTRHLSRIVGDLIRVARGRLQDIPLTLEDVAVTDLVASAIDMLGTAAGTSTIAAHIKPGLRIRADRDRIRQALVNYLTNAGRYGEGTVEIRASSTSDGALIEVHDNGPGIPKKYEFSVWERFERGAHTFMSGVQGSGLGLPIARGLVAAHHGHTGYRRSELLGGACFWLSIPSSANTNTLLYRAPAPKPSLVGVTKV